MIRPALETLHRAHPDILIDLLIPDFAKPLFEADPRVHKILTLKDTWFSSKSLKDRWLAQLKMTDEIKRQCYDAAVDFRGDLRHHLMMVKAGVPIRIGYGITGGGFMLTQDIAYDCKLHQVQLNQALLSFLQLQDRPIVNTPLHFPAEQIQDWRKRWHFLFDTDAFNIAVHPGAGYPSKRWPAEYFHELMQRIAESNAKARFVLIGSEDEKKLFIPSRDLTARTSDLRGKTSLGELAYLLSRFDYFIGHDSGPAHIAAAQGIPGLIIMSGTNRSQNWRPFSDQLSLIEFPVACSPCEARQCPLGHHDCMRKLLPDAVFKRIQILMPRCRGTL